jgi:hypothetical protein
VIIDVARTPNFCKYLPGHVVSYSTRPQGEEQQPMRTCVLLTCQVIYNIAGSHWSQRCKLTVAEVIASGFRNLQTRLVPVTCLRMGTSLSGFTRLRWERVGSSGILTNFWLLPAAGRGERLLPPKVQKLTTH